MFVGRESSRVNVDVGIDLDGANAVARSLQECTQAASGDTLAEGAAHATSDDDEDAV